MILTTDTQPSLLHEIIASTPRPVLKVLGLGGGGCNAVERMIELGLSGVEFIAANTDRQALSLNRAETKILLGPTTTRGFGAGGDPMRGREAAEESRTELNAALAGADMVFLTAGMGGGTGTGSISVAAEVARSLGAVTIATVTTPFSFEKGVRQKNADTGLSKLREFTHTLIAIPNDRLLYVAPKDLPIQTAFRLADDVLRQAVQGISELITETGLINVDFAHIRRLMLLGGGALMSIGQGQGETKTFQALEQALHHPLLESVSLDNAAGVIANFTGGDDLSLSEVQETVLRLQEKTGPQAEIVPGVVTDNRLRGKAQLILVITGLGARSLEETMPGLIKTKLEAESHEEKPVQPAEFKFPPVGQDENIPAFLRRRIGWSERTGLSS
jgi:cell division protein FtsZ